MAKTIIKTLGAFPSALPVTEEPSLQLGRDRKGAPL